MKASIPASGSDSRDPEHRPIGGQDFLQIHEKMLDKTIAYDKLNEAVDETGLCQ